MFDINELRHLAATIMKGRFEDKEEYMVVKETASEHMQVYHLQELPRTTRVPKKTNNLMT